MHRVIIAAEQLFGTALMGIQIPFMLSRNVKFAVQAPVLVLNRFHVIWRQGKKAGVVFFGFIAFFSTVAKSSASCSFDNLCFGLSSSQSEKFVQQVSSSSFSTDGQRIIAKQKSMSDASRASEYEQEAPQIQIEKALQQLSLNERFYLRVFFRSLIYENHGGHTLFFQKPISLLSFISEIPRTHAPYRFNSYKNMLIARGWKVWNQFQSLFEHSNFIFMEEKVQYEYSGSRNDVVNVYFIRKPALLKVIVDNKEIFEQILGENFSPEKLIEAIERKEPLTSLLDNNEGLLGILLGYGTKSSMAYESKLEDIRRSGYKQVGLHSFRAQKILGCKIEPVSILSIPGSLEAQNIIDRYSLELAKIQKVCYRRDLLKTTLLRLSENSGF